MIDHATPDDQDPPSTQAYSGSHGDGGSALPPTSEDPPSTSNATWEMPDADERPPAEGEVPATRALPPDQIPTPTPEAPRSGASWDTVEANGEFQPGQMIFNRYIVQGKIGRGGMGTVWLVTHRELNTSRAIKLIVAGISFDAQARARFRREAQVMASFAHPNAVIVHDARLTEQDVAYIDMEYIQGQSLDRIIRRGEPMPLDWIARILTQLCDVLQVAHDHGIVHRDLKPANMMLVGGRPPGRELLKVLDFGIAKILRDVEPEGAPHTMTGMFMGTPPYASPEQADGEADVRSDLYSVGVILYEFFTGFRPFTGPAARVLVDTISNPPPSFSAVNPKVTPRPEFEALVMRCLAKDRADRPQTARELSEAFQALMPRPAAEPREDSAAPPLSRRTIGLLAGTMVLLLLTVFWIARRLAPAPKTDSDPAPIAAPPNFAAAPDATVDEAGRPSAIVPEGPLAGLGMRLIVLPGGTLGEGPTAQAVPAFALGETEVTNGQMRAYFEEKRLRPPPEFEAAIEKLIHNPEAPVSRADADLHPAVGIDLHTAEDFARWAGAVLPEEAQWAYAASSGGQPGRRFVWKDNKPTVACGGRANLDTMDCLPTRTAKVKNYPDDRTDQGLYDMTGNVREWCRIVGTGASDPQSVARGGSYYSVASEYDNRVRELIRNDQRLDTLGFRIAVKWPEP